MLFLVGAHKCGTTSVAEWLGADPNITLAAGKEPNTLATRSVEGLDDPYWDLFDDRPVKLDASTNYAKAETYPGTAQRIHTVAPDASIIYLTRDPLDRLWSAWRQHMDESGYRIAPEFERAIRSDRSLVDATLYHRQLLAYRELFPPENIFTLPLELLITDVQAQRDLASFAGAQPRTPLPVANAGGDKGQEHPLVRRLTEQPGVSRMLEGVRKSPARGVAATLRRRLFLVPLEAVCPEIEEFQVMDCYPEIEEDASSYLDLIGRPRRVWPSLLP